jgi:Phage integrase family
MARARECIDCSAKWTRQGANSSTACPTCGGASEALRQITFHALRHSGTTLVADRVPLVVLKERRGHASVTTTANIYVHRSRWTGAVAVEQLEQPFPALEKAEGRTPAVTPQETDHRPKRKSA